MKVFVAVIGPFVVLAIVSWIRQVWRLRKHTGLSRTEFISHFEQMGISPAVPGLVYDHFRSMGIWNNFVPSPSDSLERTYKTVDEDVSDNLNDILRKLGCEMPNSAILKQWGRPIESLSDVVAFIDWVKKLQGQPA